MIAWSWSRLDCFEKCPKQFYHKNVAKDVKEDFQAPHFIRGNRIHAHLENAMKSGVVNSEIKHMAHTIHSLRGVEWTEVYIEDQFSFDESMNKSSWYDTKKTWFRIKLDYLAIKDDVAVTIDWKTGKNRGHSDQLDLYDAFVLYNWPEVQEVRSAYQFVDEPKEKRVEKRSKPHTRKDAEHLWHGFLERAELIEIADENNDWPAKPSNFNCKWCPVKTCAHNKGG
jgi:hypothetical protein